MSLIIEWVLLAFDLVRRIYNVFPKAYSSLKFLHFINRPLFSKEQIYLAIDSYKDPRPRVGNRYVKEMPFRGPNIPIVGADIIYGQFTPHEASLVSSKLLELTGKLPKVVIDTEVQEESNGSFICFGSADSNIKTYDFQNKFGNKYYEWVFNKNGRAIRMNNVEYGFNTAERKDRAVLLKARNPFNSRGFVIICAGLGEWGTYGSVRYFLNNWKYIYKTFNRNDVCLLLEIDVGQPDAVKILDTKFSTEYIN